MQTRRSEEMQSETAFLFGLNDQALFFQKKSKNKTFLIPNKMWNEPPTSKTQILTDCLSFELFLFFFKRVYM